MIKHSRSLEPATGCCDESFRHLASSDALRDSAEVAYSRSTLGLTYWSRGFSPAVQKPRCATGRAVELASSAWELTGEKSGSAFAKLVSVRRPGLFKETAASNGPKSGLKTSGRQLTTTWY
jgi:hypothetical protein